MTLQITKVLNKKLKVTNLLISKILEYKSYITFFAMLSKNLLYLLNLNDI